MTRFPIVTSPAAAAPGLTRRRSVRRARTIAALTALFTLAVGACSNGGAAPTNGSPSSPGVLNIWYGSEPGQKDAITNLIAQWDQENDDVTVEITAMGPELNPPSLLPALSAGEGPDIWAGNVGPGQPQAFIKAGLVKDLTPNYCERGWGKTIPAELATIVTSDEKLWAVPNSVESTGMFYRKSIFKKLGLEVPTTWAELQAVIQKLKDNGYKTPIGAAGQDAWPVTQMLGNMWGSAVGPDGLKETLFGGGTWTSDGYQEATKAFVALNENGDFGTDANSYTYQATMAAFYTGKVPMTYTGGFVIPGAKEDAGENFDDIGVFSLPNPTGGPIYANASPGEGWYVNANSKLADKAVDLLNYLFFVDANRTKILEGGLVPVGAVNLDAVQLPSVLEELLAEQSKYRANGTIPAFIEGLTPGSIFDNMQSGVQGVLAKKTTAEQLLGSIQTAWDDEKAQGTTLNASSPKC